MRIDMPADRVRGAFDYAAIGMALIAPDGRWLHVNPALCDFTGYTEDELLRMSFRDIIDPEDSDSHPALFEKVLAGKTPVARLQKRYRHKQGHTVWGNLIISCATTYLIVQIQDITEQKNLEEQLIQAQKLEAVGRLAGGIAHDFNNILTVINGFTELVLSRDLQPGHPAYPKLREVLRAGQRAGALTRQLLLFSRKQVVTATHLSLNTLIVDLTKMLGRLIGEDVTLNMQLNAEQLIFGDAGQIEQVILNLAVNARDAMPTGGTLYIETEDQGDQVVLTIRDDGCGMTDEVKAHIFEPFFTTKEVGKGTGLGLAVVNSVMQQCEGRVEVVSSVGKGTRFKLFFPAARNQSRPDSKASIEGSTRPRGSELVLVVEDDENVRDLSVFILKDCGFRVLEARNGEEALHEAHNCREHIHLLVTDVVMPGVGGRQLSDRLVEIHPEMKTLFLSGYTEDAVVRHGVFHDQMHFLQKPFSPAALAHKVRETIDA